jgi:hypothetical protein
MGHYAKVKNEIVTQVIVAKKEFIDTIQDNNNSWIKTSYNTRGGVHYQPNSNEPSQDQSKALRKNYAGIGYVYDSVRDAFYQPKPFNSFILNEETCIWEAPIAAPTDSKSYQWNEDSFYWEEIID